MRRRVRRRKLGDRNRALLPPRRARVGDPLQRFRIESRPVVVSMRRAIWSASLGLRGMAAAPSSSCFRRRLPHVPRQTRSRDLFRARAGVSPAPRPNVRRPSDRSSSSRARKGSEPCAPARSRAVGEDDAENGLTLLFARAPHPDRRRPETVPSTAETSSGMAANAYGAMPGDRC
jgi:hypothetical protein